MAVKKLRSRIPLPRTLRGRLIAGLVALLALGCASVGLVTYFAVQGALSRELDNQLQTATQLAYNCWRANGDGTAAASAIWTSAKRSTGAASPNPKPCNGVSEGTFVAIVTKTGTCRSTVVPATAVHLTTADETSLLDVPPSPDPAGSEVQPFTRYLDI